MKSVGASRILSLVWFHYLGLKMNFIRLLAESSKEEIADSKAAYHNSGPPAYGGRLGNCTKRCLSKCNHWGKEADVIVSTRALLHKFLEVQTKCLSACNLPESSKILTIKDMIECKWFGDTKAQDPQAKKYGIQGFILVHCRLGNQATNVNLRTIRIIISTSSYTYPSIAVVQAPRFSLGILPILILIKCIQGCTCTALCHFPYIPIDAH